jgi:hypothetical protein
MWHELYLRKRRFERLGGEAMRATQSVLGHRLSEFKVTDADACTASACCLECGKGVTIELLPARPEIYGEAVDWQCGPEPRLRL